MGVAHTVRLDGIQAHQKIPLRIGDSERDRAIAALGDHFAAGRLNAEEFEQRVDQAIRARFNDDLEPLFVDLPRTVEPCAESKSEHRSGAHLAWSPVVWFAPRSFVHYRASPAPLAGVDVPVVVPDQGFSGTAGATGPPAAITTTDLTVTAAG